MSVRYLRRMNRSQINHVQLWIDGSGTAGERRGHGCRLKPDLGQRPLPRAVRSSATCFILKTRREPKWITHGNIIYFL